MLASVTKRIHNLGLRCQCLGVLCTVVVVEVLYAGAGSRNWLFSSLHSRSPDRRAQLLLDQQSCEDFLNHYEAFCSKNFKTTISVHSQTPEEALSENASIILHATTASTPNASTLVKFCSCVPDSLIGRINVSTELRDLPSFSILESKHRDKLEIGGHWLPHDCIPRHRVAIIIPYRDRQQHLIQLLDILHPMLQRQQLDYTIFVVEQAEPFLFNKAMLMNAGFAEARSHNNFDCYIFHDVDMIPEDDRNFYVCSKTPRHVGSHLSKWNYKLPYSAIFGGVTAFTGDQFESINGFSNLFYGWGGEDDDMYSRIRAQDIPIARFPQCVARYTMISHSADKLNPVNSKRGIGFLRRSTHYSKDGLKTLQYSRQALELRPLYTWIYIALPPPPNSFKTYTRPWDPPYINILTLSCLFLIIFIITWFTHDQKLR